MNDAYRATAFDASPEAAIEAIESHGGPALVDLDETLYLRNSTEDFIDSVRPGLAALLLMRALDVLSPWRFTGGVSTRDVWRVRAISLCFPWSMRRWKALAPSLAGKHTNRRLLAALQSSNSQPAIVTVGFRPLVTPLVAAMGLGHLPLVAASSDSMASRRDGKLALALKSIASEDIRRALVVTDSIEDLPLLKECARPLRTIWPEAKFSTALSRVYLPGEYISRIKRPGAKYIFRGIIQEDLAYWMLSSVALAPRPVLHVAGLLLLALSFWAIYERGYVDNDLVASTLESEPSLSESFHVSRVATPAIQPWIWAVAAGAAALFVLRWPLTPDPVDGVKWLGVLVGTYGWFRWYNRMDKPTRVWMYSVLQFSRLNALIVIVPVLPSRWRDGCRTRPTAASAPPGPTAIPNRGCCCFF
jgi:phosphoserine phosphatase